MVNRSNGQSKFIIIVYEGVGMGMYIHTVVWGMRNGYNLNLVPQQSITYNPWRRVNVTILHGDSSSGPSQ